MDKSKLKSILLKTAEDHIDKLLAQKLRTEPISDWEDSVIQTALNSNLLQIDGGYFKIDGRSWSIWTLNREYWTHICAYYDLITSGVARPDDIQLEKHYMDIVVYNDGAPKIAIEVKVKNKEVEKLITKMKELSVDPPLTENDRGNDPLRKIKSILKLKPKEFWIVTPTKKWMFSINFQNTGFKLQEIEADISNQLKVPVPITNPAQP